MTLTLPSCYGKVKGYSAALAYGSQSVALNVNFANTFSTAVSQFIFSLFLD